MNFLIGVILFFLIASQSSVVAGIPDIFYYFEDIGHTQAIDSGGSGIDVALVPRSSISDEAAKFGKGSLKIQAPAGGKTGRGWYVYQKSGTLTSLNSEIKKMTILCWVRPADIQKSIVVLRRTQRDPENTILFMYASNCLIFSINLNGKSYSAASPAIPLFFEGDWTHLAVTFNEGEVAFYVNGDSWGERKPFEITAIPAPEDDASFAGFLETPAGTLVDDYGIFGNRVLTQDEIGKIYRDGLSAFPK